MRMHPLLVAIVGPTATGKSALGLALARRFGGEIVSCDSTAVYRGFDIGTEKPTVTVRNLVPHHLIDVTEPTEEYSAARYSREASAVVRAITGRGRLPILVGGTGLYYRALTRGLFLGPGQDILLRQRLFNVARKRGVAALHRMVGRIDPVSAQRIHCRDERRLIRALEVYYLTGIPLTNHFTSTFSPIKEYEVLSIALRLSTSDTATRVSRRVEKQFNQGLLDEIRGLLSRGVPDKSRPFSGLVYRQALDHLRGLYDEATTRELIVRENRRYARRQLIWFRKEPNLTWIDLAGECPEALRAADKLLTDQLRS